MANLNIGASLVNVTSLSGLPVTVRTVYATLSAPSTISLASAMYQGQIMNVVINPTTNMILPMPTTTGWYSTFGDTLTLMKGTKTILTIYCIGNGLYNVLCNQKDPTNGYDFVDLGLPSGLLWATCNVGASQPHEYGKYFQWGATEGYYKGSAASEHSDSDTAPFSWFAKPPFDQLDAAHDAARANMGGNWRMPTSAETKELVTYTTTGWTSVSGVNGMRFTSKSNSSNSIFIPAAGRYQGGGSLYEEGSYSYNWTSSYYYKSLTDTYALCFGSSSVYPHNTFPPYQSNAVRGVLG